MAWPPAGTTEVQTANGWQITLTATNTSVTWPTVATDGFTLILTGIETYGVGGGSVASGGLDTNGSSGSGGGAWSKSAASLPGTVQTGTGAANIPAATTGAAGGDVWFNRTTNAAPGSASAGALAKGGTSGAANAGAVGVGGAAASGVGDTKNSGGNGGAGGLSAGGAGGGAGGPSGTGGNATTTTAGTGNNYGGGGGGANGLGGAASTGGAGAVVLTYVKQYAKNTAETLTASDSDVRQFSGARSTAETLSLTDAVARIAVYNKALADALATSDADTRVVQFGRAPTDAVTGLDSDLRRVIDIRILTADNYPVSDAVSRVLNYGRFPQDGPGDWTVRNATKSISGITRDQAGNPLGGCTVLLFREVDNFMCQQTTSDAGGNYTFPRDLFDPYIYFVLSYKPGASPQIHGVSDRDIAPS